MYNKAEIRKKKQKWKKQIQTESQEDREAKRKTWEEFKKELQGNYV